MHLGRSRQRTPFGAVAGWFVVLVILARVASAQAVVRAETVSGADGWPIRFSYYPALEKLANNQVVDVKKAPVAILLHGTGGSRLFWDKTSAAPGGNPGPFAEVLQAKGFAVVSVDLRKHGESVREGQERLLVSDYELMVGDLAAIKQFLIDEHQKERLNVRKLAIVALDDMCAVAATYAELDWRQPPFDDHAIPSERTPRGQDVRALVLVSPSSSAGRVQTTGPLKFLANPEFRIAFEVLVGKKDASGFKTARTLFGVVNKKANEDRTKFEEFDTNEKSQHLFGNPRIKAENQILLFLKTNVQDLDIPWMDRRSRRDR